MKLEEIQKEEIKNVVVTARVTKKNSEWLKKNKVSVGLLIEKAIEELRIAGKNLKKANSTKVKRGKKR